MKQEKGQSESEQWIWCHVEPGSGFVGFKLFVTISSTKRAEQSNYMEDEYTSNKKRKVIGVLSFLRKVDKERRTVN
jgi:hypothetical protein